MHIDQKNECLARREFLKQLSVASIAALGSAAPRPLSANDTATEQPEATADACVLLWMGGGMAAHWLAEFPWPIAFLYAALVVVTGPTVITPLLKHVRVDRQVSVLLEGEGVLIDPVGAILAVLVLDVILNGDADVVILPGTKSTRGDLAFLRAQGWDVDIAGW